MTTSITIATRESRLALWQAEHVQARLANELGLTATLLGMTTRGCASWTKAAITPSCWRQPA